MVFDEGFGVEFVLILFVVGDVFIFYGLDNGFEGGGDLVCLYGVILEEKWWFDWLSFNLVKFFLCC